MFYIQIKKVLLERYKRVFSSLMIMALLALALNLGAWVNQAKAAQISQLKDTLSDSDLGVVSNHTVEFQTKNVISASSTIVIDFPDSFQSTSTPAFANTDPLDFDIVSSTADQLVLSAAGACPVNGIAAFEITSISTGNTFTFTHCNGTDSVPANLPLAVKIGTHATQDGAGTSQLVNSPGAGSYLVSVTIGNDSATTRVVVIDDVVVTASVSTNFIFTVSGVAAGEAINGDGVVTSAGATATALPFGELVPNTAEVLGQTLSVTTNAKNGFAVTVQQDQNLTSANGADIDLFKNGVPTVPLLWASPTAILDVEATYGHYGVASEDADLTGGAFTSGWFDGNFASARRRIKAKPESVIR